MFKMNLDQVKCEGSASTALATSMLSAAVLGTAQASALNLTSKTSAFILSPPAAVNTISLAVAAAPTFSRSTAHYTAFPKSSHQEKER